jgi:hypothetical protein
MYDIGLIYFKLGVFIMTEASNAPSLNDEQLLNYTQNYRTQLVEVMVKDGMPVDSKDRLVLLSALDSIDKQAINKKKIATAEQGLEADRLVALTVAKMAERFGSQIPFERTISGEARVIPEPSDQFLPRAQLVEGETDTSISSITYNEIMGDD